jgi:sugar phosphate isomerase/epimerase
MRVRMLAAVALVGFLGREGDLRPHRRGTQLCRRRVRPNEARTDTLIGMIPGLSTQVFFQQRLHPGLLDALVAGGARTIEVVAARHHFDYTDRIAVRDIAQWFRSNDVRAVLHQPLYLSDRADAQWSRHVAANLSIVATEKNLRIASLDEVKRAIEAAEQVPFGAAVLHLGLKGDAWDEAAIDRSLTAIEHLKAFATPLGVRLLLENLENDITTPAHLIEILKVGHFDPVGICLDVGHLHLGQSVAETCADSGLGAALATVGKRLGQLHLHDNHGAYGTPSDKKDEHLWPGEGTIDWNAIAQCLATVPANTPGVLENASVQSESPERVTKLASAAFRMLEAAGMANALTM